MDFYGGIGKKELPSINRLKNHKASSLGCKIGGGGLGEYFLRGGFKKTRQRVITKKKNGKERIIKVIRGGWARFGQKRKEASGCCETTAKKRTLKLSRKSVSGGKTAPIGYFRRDHFV